MLNQRTKANKSKLYRKRGGDNGSEFFLEKLFDQEESDSFKIGVGRHRLIQGQRSDAL